jgi:GT2 family glycosyltransferase
VNMLRRCLASLRRCSDSKINTEIIVLLNGMGQAAEAELTSEDVRGITILRSAVNLGFGSGCNRAAREAHGESLIFLNDDIEVEQDWLVALVTAAAEEPRAGAIGSRVVFPSGVLQEAGSVIWSDGSTSGVGRGLPAGSQAYSYRRVVDYCSACALLVRAEVWRALEGFDESFLLGYYEDADLCLRVSAMGLDVLYEPGAIVRHHEHATSADQQAVNVLFERNRARFRDKWGTRVLEQETPGELTPAAVQAAVMRARGWPTRILLIDDRVPDASIGSGAGRMLLALRELADAGYAPTVIVGDRDTGDPIPLGRLGVEVSHEDLSEHLSRPEILYDVVVISRPNNVDAALALVRRHQPQACVMYDAEALYHRRMERQAQLAVDAGAAARLLADAEAMRATEARIVAAVDSVVCVSEEEARWVRSSGASCPVEVALPLDPEAELGTRGFLERRGMLFVAGWLAGADSPNGDGLAWFGREVLPLIVTRIPWVQLYVTGACPPDALGWLESPNIKFVGNVLDLAPLYDSIRVAIIPLRYGSGVKLKALEAVARGVPVVTTSVGIEGVPDVGENAVDVTDDPAEFARATIALMEDRVLWEQRRQALQRVRSRWHATRRRWPDIVDDVRTASLQASSATAVIS